MKIMVRDREGRAKASYYKAVKLLPAFQKPRERRDGSQYTASTRGACAVGGSGRAPPRRAPEGSAAAAHATLRDRPPARAPCRGGGATARSIMVYIISIYTYIYMTSITDLKERVI